MLEAGGALGGFGLWAWGWLVRIGAVVAVVWACKHMLAVLWAGGKGRAAWEAVIGLAIIVLAYAALKDVPHTMEVVVPLGERAWPAILAEVTRGTVG
jgi:hypothetical protein